MPLLASLNSSLKLPRFGRARSAPRPSNLRIEQLEQRLMLTDGMNSFIHKEGDIPADRARYAIRVPLLAKQLYFKDDSALLSVSVDDMGSDSPMRDVRLASRHGAMSIHEATDNYFLVEASAGRFDVLITPDKTGTSRYQVDVALAGDVNGDFRVTGADIRDIASRRGSRVGAASYSVNADIDHDGDVDRLDFSLARTNKSNTIRPRPFQMLAEDQGLDSEMFHVPASDNQTTQVEFFLGYQNANFDNEFGLVVVDDASGSIDGLSPAEDGYTEAAMSHATRQTIFQRGSTRGDTNTLSLPSNSHFALYAVQNGSMEDVLNGAPEKHSVFSTLTASNSDEFDHFLRLGGNRVAFEDLTGGGDADFNDAIIDVLITQDNPASLLDLLPIDDRTIPEGRQFSFHAAANSDYDPVTFGLVGDSPEGSVLNHRTGRFRWIPTEAQRSGDYDVTIEATNDLGQGDRESFIITVAEVNQAPLLSPVPDQTITEHELFRTAVRATDPDVPSNQLTYSLDAAPRGATIDPVSGEISWHTGELNGSVEYEFTVRVTDDGDRPLSNTSAFTVSVLEHHEQPLLGTILPQEVDEKTPLSFSAMATDPDFPVETLTYSFMGDQPAGMGLNSSSGEVTWSPTEEQGPGDYVVTVQVMDSAGLTDQEDVNIRVNEVNEVPFIEPINDRTIDEQAQVIVQLTSTDPDIPLDTLTCSFLNMPTGAIFDESRCTLTWTPTENQGPGTYVITAKVTDNGEPMMMDLEQFVVDVSEVNRAPVFAAFPSQQIAEDRLLSFTALATDPDIPFNAVTYSLGVASPAGISIDPTTGELAWTPTEAQGPGQYSVTIIATDNGSPSLSDSQVVDITVLEHNRPPTIIPPTSIPASVLDGLLLELLFSATDPDIPDNTLTFELTDGTQFGATIDAQSGLFSWIPSAVGTYEFTAEVDDNVDPNLSDSHTFSLAVENCPFSDELTGFRTTQSGGTPNGQGSVVAQTCSAIMTEGDSFVVTLESSITIPDVPSTLQIHYNTLNFDTSDPTFINDAFEVALVDYQGQTLVHTNASSADAVFNITEGEPAEVGANTHHTNNLVEIDLTHLPAGSPATLVTRLVNNDSDTTTSVSIGNIEIVDGSLGTPIGASFASASVTSSLLIDFDTLSDVSGALTLDYGQTSYHKDLSSLLFRATTRNDGQYDVEGPLVVMIDHLSDPSIRVRNFDGMTPSGRPFYDFTNLLDDRLLQPGDQTRSRELSFFDPNETPFTFDLTFLGKLNEAPEIITEPNIEAIVGRNYVYNAEATDPNGDTLTFSFLTAPSGVLMDSMSGEITWSPTANDGGNHAVSIRVEDGRGGTAEQHYILSAIEPPPNRPPVFVTTPNVDAAIGQPYRYDADVTDADSDPITYELLNGPNGMIIDRESGEIQWIPPSAHERLTPVDVVVEVKDGRGGSVRQAYGINVLGDPLNYPPVIVSQPGLIASAHSLYRYEVDVIDPDEDALSFSLTDRPEGMVFNPDDGVIEWTPTLEQSVVPNDDSTLPVLNGFVAEVYAHVPDPRELAFAPDGTMFVGREEIPPAGELIDYLRIHRVGPGGSPVEEYGDIARSDPDSVAYDIDGTVSGVPGTVLVAGLGETAGLISAIYPDQSVEVIVSAPFAGRKSLWNPGGMTFDSAGRLYAIQSVNSASVFVVEGNGVRELFDLDTGDIVSIAISSDDLIYASGTDQRIRIYDLDGQLVDPSFATGHSGGLKFGPGGAWGTDLYVLGSGLLKRIDSAGISTIIGTGFHPQDIPQFGPDGALFVSNLNHDRVLRIVSATAEHHVTVEVNDGHGGFAQQSFVIDVAPNRPPEIGTVPPLSAAVGSHYAYDVDASDPDDDPLTFSLIDRPEGMSIDSEGGLIEWIPTADHLIIPNDDPTLPLLSGFVAEVYASVPNPRELAFAPDGTLYAGTQDPFDPGEITYAPIYRISPGGAVVEEFGNVRRWDRDSVGFDRDGTLTGVPGTVLSGGGAQTGEISAIYPDQSVEVIISSPFAGPRSLWNPNELHFDSTGRFYAAQSVNSGAVFISDGGDLEVLFEIDGDNASFDISSDDMIYAVGADGRIRIYNRNGELVDPAFSTGHGPVDLAFGPGGEWGTDLYALSGPAGELRRIDDQGHSTVIGTGFSRGDLFTFGPDGALYISNFRNDRIVRITSRPAEHSITVRVTDGRGGVDEQPFVVQAFQQGDGQIHGMKFNDIDGDGMHDDLEPGLEGWVLYSDQNNNLRRDPAEQFAVTDELGHYMFDRLLSGTFTIREELQPGWRQTAPGNDGAYQIELSHGQRVSDVDFGNSDTRIDDNNPPSFTSSPPSVASVNGTLRYDATVSDVDDDVVSFDLVVKPEGMAVSSASGILVWRPALSQVGTHDAILRVRDGHGGVDLQAFQITVSTNSAPVITSLPFGPAVEDLLYRYKVAAQDADGDDLTFSLLDGPDEAAIDADTGVLTWTPRADERGDHRVSIRVADDRGGENTQSFLLPVVAAGSVINEPPTITSSPRSAVGIETLYTYFVRATDSNNDPLSFSLDESPPGMDIDPTGMVFWTPAPNQLGDHPVTVLVADGRGGVATQGFTISAVQQTANTAPTITSAPAFTAQVDQLYEYDAVASDPDNDTIIWSLDSGPNGASIDALKGTLRWIPTNAQIGFHEVVVRATDIQGTAGIQGFGVNVRAINSPPVITSAPPTMTYADNPYFYSIRAEDVDNDSLSFSLTTHPDGMAIGDKTGLIHWTPNDDHVGPQDVVIRVEDGRGGVAEQTFTVSVSTDLPNGPPVITSTPEFVATVGQTYLYQIEANDPDGFSLTYQLIDGPSDMNVNANGQTIWTPTIDELGPNVVQIAAFDPTVLGASQAFTITVRESNGKPVLNNTPETTTVAEQIYAFDMNVTDPEDDPINYTLSGGPEGMTVDESGRLHWTPTRDDVGSHRVAITIQDDRGAGFTVGYDLSVIVDAVPPQVIVEANKNPVSIGEEVILRLAATDNIAVDSIGLEIDGTPVALDGTGAATVSFETFGTVDAVATATDTSGNTAQAALQLSVIDTSDVDAPTVDIISPEYDQIITAPINVIGTVDDDNLLFYTLAVGSVTGGEFIETYRVEADPGGTLAPVVDGVLGQLDPTLLENDSYTLRLTAEDAGGNIAITETLFNVAGSLKLGNFTLSFVDLSIPVQGIPIVVGRTYDTLASARTGDFGYGWSLDVLDVDLRDNVARSSLEDVGIFNPYRDGSRIYLRLPDGSREAFTVRPKVIDGSIAAGLLFTIGNYVTVEFVPDPGVTSRLELSRNFILHLTTNGGLSNPDGLPFNPASSLFNPVVFTLTTSEGIAYEIDPSSGALNHITDRNGNRLTISSDGIASTTGRKVKFERDLQGRITTVIDPAGSSITYEYDDNGDLIAVTDREGNTTRFAYNDQRLHLLEEIVDPLGRASVRSEYNDEGRLVRTIDVNGNDVKMVHDLENAIETVNDAMGNDTVFLYDRHGNVITQIDAEGGVTKRTYDRNNNELTQTVVLEDGTELTTKLGYDDNRNVISETNPKENTTYYTHDQFGNLKTETGPLGNVINRTYDGNGNLVLSGDAQGTALTYAYNTHGGLSEYSLSNGNRTEFEYDSHGNLIAVSDLTGIGETFTYDDNGNKVTNSQTWVNPDDLNERRTATQRLFYDENDRLIRTAHSNGSVTLSLYNAFGDMVQSTDAFGSTTVWVYDARNNLIETQFPDGTVVRSVFDDLDREIYTVDRHNSTSSTPGSNGTHLSYDKVGRVIQLQRLRGLTVDVFEMPDGSKESRFVSAAEVISVIRTTYDAAGRVVQVIGVNGHATTFQYDGNGKQTEVIDALGNKTQFEYDPAGRRVLQRDALGRETRYEYDALGRLLTTTYADGSYSEATYNTLGQRVSEVDQIGNTRTFAYDSFGNLTAVQLPAVADPDSVGAFVHPRYEYEYDTYGNLRLIRDPNGHETSFTFDIHDRQLTKTLPERQTDYREYDSIGRLISYSDFNGHVTEVVYDTLGRQIQESHFDRADVGTPLLTVTTAYDNLGRQDTIDNSQHGLTDFDYDTDGAVTRIASPEGVVGFRYDSATSRRIRSFTDSTDVSYEYDELGRLSTVTSVKLGGEMLPAEEQLVTSYSYDVVGNLVRIQLPNKTQTLYEYDQLNQLVKVAHLDATDTVVVSYEYELDAVGRRESATETVLQDDVVFTTTWVGYSYDALGRLTREHHDSAIDADDFITTYTYDLAGNRLEQATTDTSGTETITYTYDDNDWLLNEVSTLGKTTMYVYDDNGSLTEKHINGELFTKHAYDLRQRLESSTTFTTDELSQVIVTTAHYIYDANGIRVRVETSVSIDGAPSTVTVRRFLNDPSSHTGFAQILEEHNGTGELVFSYMTGLDVVAQVKATDAGLVIAYFGYDGHGSTRFLTDEGGAITDRYDYDAYGGALKFDPNETATSFLYGGEEFDSTTDQYYLRARYYDESIGRFNRSDPFGGSVFNPQSLHKFTFAHGDPVNASDPSGLVTVLEVQEALRQRIPIVVSVARYVYQGFMYIDAAVTAIEFAYFFLRILDGSIQMELRQTWNQNYKHLRNSPSSSARKLFDSNFWESSLRSLGKNIPKIGAKMAEGAKRLQKALNGRTRKPMLLFELPVPYLVPLVPKTIIPLPKRIGFAGFKMKTGLLAGSSANATGKVTGLTILTDSESRGNRFRSAIQFFRQDYDHWHPQRSRTDPVWPAQGSAFILHQIHYHVPLGDPRARAQ